MIICIAYCEGFSLFFLFDVLLEQKYDKWTNVVIITHVVYKTVRLWSQHYILPAVVKEGVLA